MALPKKNRLKKKSDFDKVFKEGKAVKGSFLFIKYKENKKGILNLGFSISKKLYPKASSRNRIKRVLSEKARIILKSGVMANIDLVITVKIKEKEELVVEELKRLLTLILGVR